MTTREEIIALAKECKFSSQNDTFFIADTEEIQKFFHAAQRQAYERAALLRSEAHTIFGLGAQGPIGETLDAIEWYDSSIRALIERDGK